MKMNRGFWGALLLGVGIITLPAAIGEPRYWISVAVLCAAGGLLLLWWWLDKRRKGK